MKIPSCYLNGYETARKRNPEMAELYIRHTTAGDPVADQVVEELAATTTPAEVHRIIAETLDHHENPPENSPESLRNLIADSAVVPDWFDRDLALAGTRAFIRNSDLVLGALVGGAIIEGFSTLISKSFRIRSRIVENGVRRLKQNLLQLVEQFTPGGLEPGGDGWKLSLRIRLVHAQSRMLIRNSDEWDMPTYGLPLSSAHMLLGAAAFSGRLMQHVESLGGDFSAEEQEAYIHVWRYTGLTMGIPEPIMFHDFASSLRIFEIGALCEPPPDDDAILMANSIINSAPILLGFGAPNVRRSYAKFMYQVSRELIGDELADHFRFPPAKRIREVPLLRLKKRLARLVSVFFPRWQSRQAMSQFSNMLAVSNLGNSELSYALPSSVRDEDSREW